MTRRYLRLMALGSALTLSACAQQGQVKEMKQDVRTLNKAMSQLNQETVKITQQNALNADSTRGVYLLPSANTPARLQSQIGTLRVSLVNISNTGSGMRATLRIEGESSEPLPAFSATVEWGRIVGTTRSYEEVDVQRRLINAPKSAQSPSDISIPLQLSGIDPAGHVFVRVHDIQPAPAQ